MGGSTGIFFSFGADARDAPTRNGRKSILLERLRDSRHTCLQWNNMSICQAQKNNSQSTARVLSVQSMICTKGIVTR